MIDVLIYTASGILLYLLAEAALNAIERLHGEPIPHRNIVFFIVIFTMAVILFEVITLIYTSDPL